MCALLRRRGSGGGGAADIRGGALLYCERVHLPRLWAVAQRGPTTGSDDRGRSGTTTRSRRMPSWRRSRRRGGRGWRSGRRAACGRVGTCWLGRRYDNAWNVAVYCKAEITALRQTVQRYSCTGSRRPRVCTAMKSSTYVNCSTRHVPPTLVVKPVAELFVAMIDKVPARLALLAIAMARSCTAALSPRYTCRWDAQGTIASSPRKAIQSAALGRGGPPTNSAPLQLLTSGATLGQDADMPPHRDA